MKSKVFVFATLFLLCVVTAAAQKKAAVAGNLEIYSAAEKKCDAAIEKQTWKTAETLCRSALTAANRLTDQNKPEKMQAFENYAFALFQQYKFQLALDNFTKSFELGESFLAANDPQMGDAYFNLARANQGLANMEKAVEQYQKAEQIFRDAYDKAATPELKSSHKASIRKTLLLQQFIANYVGDADKVRELEKKMADLENAKN